MLACKMGLAPSFPIEMEPVYFERAEVYSSTGKRINTDDHRLEDTTPDTPFHVIHEAIYREMVDVRRTTHKPREQLENVDFDQIVDKYGRFSLGNVAEFRLEFINFDKDNDALLSFEDVCRVLDKLADDSQVELRRQAYVEAMPQTLEMCDFQSFVGLCDALGRKRDEMEELGITGDMDYDTAVAHRTHPHRDSIRAEAEIVQRPGATDRSPVSVMGRYHCPVVEFIVTEMDPTEICNVGKCNSNAAAAATKSSPNSPSKNCPGSSGAGATAATAAATTAATTTGQKENFVKNNVMVNKQQPQHSTGCADPGPSNHMRHEQTGDRRHLKPSSASLSDNNRVT